MGSPSRDRSVDLTATRGRPIVVRGGYIVTMAAVMRAHVRRGEKEAGIGELAKSEHSHWGEFDTAWFWGKGAYKDLGDCELIEGEGHFALKRIYLIAKVITYTVD